MLTATAVTFPRESASGPGVQTGNTDTSSSVIRIVPHLDSPRSLVFAIVERELREGVAIKIGRFTDKFFMPTRVTFRSKVVSRGHAEIWTENNMVYIRDTKSSSGTFLNRVRLSPPNQESRPFELKSGDIIQLGVDYQGGAEEMYRCVKMRIQLNQSWEKQINNFSIQAFRALQHHIHHDRPPSNEDSSKKDAVSIEDCCICLYAITPFQALFVAPCSHTFHYKCCRPLLMNHPGFQCPLCRSYADLEASVAVEVNEVLQIIKSKQISHVGSGQAPAVTSLEMSSSNSSPSCGNYQENETIRSKPRVFTLSIT
ncbi:SMAD/FHA domain-containing protein [Radiomyces spectabilis]|uniref:SMAD/FHA domain-containing protein n=1 Tax=Radiomyces spectabilis TaxID=64574 RepID=UPI00221EAED7|nr:SMAD/FHA domain-containing protein [Radiomyces spectabilis]KAI8369628.1 SMAD/FHA domain-containing protein [Radiomyces spectabilis]